MACSYRSDHVKQSPNYQDGEFQNQVANDVERKFGDFFRFVIKEGLGDWPEWIENPAYNAPEFKDDEAHLIFINHSTFLLHIDGRNLLFDPIFTKTAGPTEWLGVKRRRAPALPMEDVPKIDAIFISHNHYDHLDIPTLQYFAKRDAPDIFVPLGDAGWMENHNLTNLYELDWWQSHDFDGCLKVDFVPAQHASARGLFDRNQSLWGGFVISHPALSLFHAGDTGYGPHFLEIGQRYNINVAMLPIGSYKPDFIMEYVHMGPDGAQQALHDLGADYGYGMHFNTFRLTAVDFGEADATLDAVLALWPDDTPKIDILNIGEFTTFPLSKGCE